MGRPALPDPPKSCAACLAPMTRKRFGDRLEDRLVFQRRRFCDSECAARARLQENPSPRALIQRAAKVIPLGKRCERCRSRENLQRHHKDRNRANNDPMNVETLCAKCHAEEHWSQEKRLGYIARSEGGTATR